MSVRFTLVTRLVRNVSKPVPELVAEQQRAPRLAAREARAEHGVGVLFLEHRTIRSRSLRVVLEIGVVDHRDLAGRVLERGADRRALAAILGMAQELPLDARVRPAARAGLVFAQHLRRPVARAIVDHDHLDARELRARLEHLQPVERGATRNCSL